MKKNYQPEQPPLRESDRAFYGQPVPKHRPTLRCPACSASTTRAGVCKKCEKAGIVAEPLF